MEVLTRNDSCPAERLYIKRFHSGAESARVVVSSIFFFMWLFQWLEWEAKVLLHFHSASSFRARGCSVGGYSSCAYLMTSRVGEHKRGLCTGVMSWISGSGEDSTVCSEVS